MTPFRMEWDPLMSDQLPNKGFVPFLPKCIMGMDTVVDQGTFSITCMIKLKVLEVCIKVERIDVFQKSSLTGLESDWNQ